MRQRFTPLVTSLCLLGMVSAPVFAATDKSQMDKLAQQISQLQHQVTQLQAQLNAGHRTSAHPKKSAASVASESRSTPTITNFEQGEDQTGGTATTNLPTSGLTYLPVDVDVPGQSFVSSGPYIGIPLQFSGSNLIINSPTVNNDLALLKIRKNIHQRLQSLGVIEDSDHAHVLLSGVVEGQALYQNIGGGSDSTGINLSNATLDTYILGPSQWLSGLMSFTYDSNSGPSEGSLDNNSTVLNSRVYLTQGFITIGNLTKTSVYGTFGQFYVPFGTYSTNMVTDPLTKSMARTKARAISVGYQPQIDDSFYGAAYIFPGDTHAGATSRVNNGGINLGYHFLASKVNGDIGGGVIANIADSIGMQFVSNSATTFNGFGGINGTGNERIAHRVPAYDIRGLISIGQHIDLLAEYITASTSFNSGDLTMNNQGAKPQALNAEAAYTFDAFARPSSIAVGYGMTKDALALQLPAQRYSMVFNTSIWRDTLQALEFRHENNYAASSVASGSGVPAPQSSGKSNNIVTAQFDIFF
jgi:hypothetical protein